MRRCISEPILITMGREYSAQFQEDNYIQRMKLMSCFIMKCWSVWAQQKRGSSRNVRNGESRWAIRDIRSKSERMR